MDLNFAIMIDSPLRESDLFHRIFTGLRNAERIDGHIRHRGNIIKIDTNPASEVVGVKSSKDSWLYYKFELSAFRVLPVDIDNQKALAKEIVSLIRESGELAELVADFEI